MKLLPLLAILPLIAATPAFAGVLMFPKNLTPQKYLSNCQSVNGSASQSGPRAMLCKNNRFAVTCTFDDHTICADVENAPARLFFFEEARTRPTLLTGESGAGQGGSGSGGGSGDGGGGGGGGFSCISPCDDGGSRPPSDPSAAGSGSETMGLPPSGNGSGID